VPRVAQARHDGAQAPAATTRRRDRAGGPHGVCWCAAPTLAPLPAPPQPLVLSRTARAEQVTPGTLASRVAALRVAHQPRGHARPTTHPLVRAVLSGICRTRGTRPVQVQGLTRDLLTRLLQATGDRRRDRRTRALLAVASARLGRRSALIALAVADRERTPDGSATVRLRRRTPDPEGTSVPLSLAPDTLASLEAWLAAAGITTGLVFRALTKGGGCARGSRPMR